MKREEIKEFNFDKDFDYKIIKNLSEKELKNLAASLRKKIILEVSLHGGHLSSNLGVVDLIIALFRHYDFPKDKIIFDVGHQCYAYKILTGRPLNDLREENGIAGFPKKEESNFDIVDVGHSSTSISEAMGLALTRDLNNEKYDVISLIGDSSIANGLSFEALNHLGDFDHKVVVILNDNEMSITTPIGGFNRLLQRIRISPKYIRAKRRYQNFFTKHKALRSYYEVSRKIYDKFRRHIFSTNLFEDLGLYYHGVIDGHDFEELEGALKRIDSLDKPVVLHVATKKGKGYSFAEEDKVGKWHAVSPFDIKTGEVLSPSKSCWPKYYASLLEEAMSQNKNIIAVSPATGLGSYLKSIKEKYPERYFDVGIAEEHAVTFAAGIANGGYHPYISIYSTFLQRSYDEILHDVSLMNLGVTFLIDHAGLVGNDGETHQGIFDNAFLKTIPNITIVMAKDKKEAKALFDFSLTYNHPLAIRYTKSSDLYEGNDDSQIIYGKWKKLIESNNHHVAIISYGPHINELSDLNDVTIINALFIKPIDESMLKTLLDYKDIVIYDPYGTKEGFAFDVVNSLNYLGYKNKIILKTLPTEFIKKGKIIEQEKRYGLDTDSVKSFVRDLLK